MLFSNLYHYLKGEKNFDIKLNCSTDLHEIRDVELLDGTQTSYSTDIVIPLSFHRIHSLRSVFLLTARTICFPMHAQTVPQ